MLINIKDIQQHTTSKPAITYPCVWLYKVIGTDADVLTKAVTTVCPAITAITPSKTSSGGKYCSLNVEIEVTDEASRLAIYQNLKNHLAVKAVL
jgi:putative lipoic acid-binding regulatory protein